MPEQTKAPLVGVEPLTEEEREMMRIEEDLLEADLDAHRDERFPVWFLRKRKEIDDAGAFLKEELKRLSAEFKAKRRAFELRWGPKFREMVTDDLAALNMNAGAKPRKLIRYPTGQAGLRKAPDKLVIHDEEEATKWAWANCRKACDIKLARTGPLLEHIKASRTVDKQTGEEASVQIPGVEFIEGGDKPSPRLEALDALSAPKPPARPSLPDAPAPPEPEASTVPAGPVSLSDIARPSQRSADGNLF